MCCGYTYLEHSVSAAYKLEGHNSFKLGGDTMQQWDRVTTEMWAEVDPDEIRFTTLYDEIVFEEGHISYRSHTADHSGPLHDLFEEMCHRFGDLHLDPPPVEH